MASDFAVNRIDCGVALRPEMRCAFVERGSDGTSLDSRWTSVLAGMYMICTLRGRT